MSVRVTNENAAALGAGGTSNVRVTEEHAAALGSGGTSNVRVTSQVVAALCSVVVVTEEPQFHVMGFIGI